MTKIQRIAEAHWYGPAGSDAAVEARAALERGDVPLLPNLAFTVEPVERVLFTPAILGSSKNASYDPATGRLGGTSATGQDAEILRRFIHRFSESAAGGFRFSIAASIR